MKILEKITAIKYYYNIIIIEILKVSMLEKTRCFHNKPPLKIINIVEITPKDISKEPRIIKIEARPYALE